MDEQKSASNEHNEQVALFRYGLIADLIHRQPHERGLYALLRHKTAQSYCIPGSRRTRVATETLRGWLSAYKRGGFDALRPRRRRDQGRSRALPQPVADLLCKLKDETPALSVVQIIKLARDGGVPAEVDLAPSTVHRLLSRAGLMQHKPEDPTSKDLRRFAYQKAGQLWMTDVMHGPSVAKDGKRKFKVYLHAFIDDATRVIPYAAFAFAENTAAFLPILKQAIARRGLPQRLFCDRGAAFTSKHLALVCAKLGVTLIHARPYHAAGKGKIERWFRTCRLQLLPTLTADDLASIDALNRRLWTWVESEYHQSPHKGLDGQTPLDRWAMASDEVKLPEPGRDLDEVFLFEERRKVAKDRTVSLHGVVYEVDALLVGETVQLRFDPARLGAPIDVWHKGKRVQSAKRVDVYANCFVRRDSYSRELSPNGTAPTPPPAGLRLADFAHATTDKEGGR
jgi:putative transposase